MSSRLFLEVYSIIWLDWQVICEFGCTGADLRALLTEAQLGAVHEALDAQSASAAAGPSPSQVRRQ